MNIKKLKGKLVLEPFTSNDCYNCGLIAGQIRDISVDVADYGLKSMTVPDKEVLMALLGDAAGMSLPFQGDSTQ